MGIRSSTRYDCPNCKSKDVDSEITTTTMHCSSFFDNEGNKHDHDRNSRNIRFTCNVCKTKWIEKDPYTCWCGWIQGNEKSGYQGERFNKQ